MLGRTKTFTVRYLLAGIILLLAVLLAASAVSLQAEAGAGEAVDAYVIPVDVFPKLRFELPSVIANVGDERLFIVEQVGRIWSVSGRGEGASKTLFLDIAGRVQDGGERGLLGLAFHPNYAQNGYFYVNYTTLTGERTLTHISRFQVTANPNIADPSSEVILLEQEQPYSNHNGGDLHFDPQGMLVIALGDGGSGGDPQERSQNAQTFLGKLLRIDVDRMEGGKNYAIPADNPFIGQAALDEIWTLGLRNPWRFSFDRSTGDLYIGDVGQNQWEEVDYVPAAQSGGQNFEWSLKEGFVDFKPGQDTGPGALTPPIHVYSHSVGCSVTGGFVYRGKDIGGLDGVYVYADYCSGQIYGLVRDGQGKWQNRLLAEGEIFLSTFGEDNLGELYFASRNSGTIYRLQEARHVLLPIVRS